MKQLLLACFAACLLAAAGCGDKTDKTDDKGKGSSGASTKPSEWIVGTWDVKPDGAPAELKMQWEFKSGGDIAMTMTAGDESKIETGSWKTVSEDKMKLVMDVTVKNEPEPKQVTATFTDGDSATLEAEGESEKLSMTRAD